MLNLAGDTKRFPPSKLPPTWVEADRLVKLRREEGHHILSVRDLVVGLAKGKEDPNCGGPANARQGGEGWDLVSGLDLVKEDSNGIGVGGGGASRQGGPADARQGGEGWEDARNAVVSTVREREREGVREGWLGLFVVLGPRRLALPTYACRGFVDYRSHRTPLGLLQRSTALQQGERQCR